MKNNHNKKQYAVFIGGETGGPVMPLIAVAKAWQEQDSNLHPIFVDVKKSVASRVVARNNYIFKSIFAGKLRRYWTIKNFLTPFLVLIGFIQSILILIKYRPKVAVGAGGYVQIPVIFAAWILRIPTVIHQQDIVPTLANKICALVASRITTTFEKSVKDFPQGSGFSKNYAKFNKIEWTGNPFESKSVQISQNTKDQAQKLFKLQSDWPTVLVSGGGSGARGLNQALIHNLPELLKVAQVIHSTGVGKSVKPPIDLPAVHDRYHQYEYIENMDLALVAADVVIARAGVGTITDLSAFSKISIIVPMPDSHQEWNALYLYEHEAAIVKDQRDITPETFGKIVRKVLFDVAEQKKLQKNMQNIMPHDGAQRMLKIILNLIQDGK